MENPYCKYNAKNWMEDNNISQEQREEMFPGISKEVCTNKQGGLATSGNYDQVTFDNQIQSYIEEHGLPCWYYPYLYQEEKMEELTGEHSAAGYGRPFEIIIVVDVKDNPSWVSALGVESSETVTAWVHIRQFKEKIYPILDKPDDSRYEDYNTIYVKEPWKTGEYMKKIKPKPKDCFQVLTSACDREWDAGARIWEITNVEDEIFTENFNFAQGHYVWKITAKRYRYSFEYGLSTLDKKSEDNPMLGELGERGNHQVYENEILKMYLSGTKIVTEDSKDDIVAEETDENIFDEQFETKVIKYTKKYSQAEICDDSKKEVFDMEKNTKGVYDHIDANGYF